MTNKLPSDEMQLIAFTIISHSGVARAKIHEAFKAMRESKFYDSNRLLEESNDELLMAHQSQTELLQNYANGLEINIEIIMIHAQDHLMNTMTLREVAIEMSYLYELYKSNSITS